ncbi:hypothetical protein BLNAU_20568 [Blattamonas nauphoetae]|uniref:Uncharacterized protein n=1 Tax=Blattamonas nauphoetae TaxID=2049346 RepID=A0ABQ9WYC6_9EUKA|nr:hypothetical protein BLNAU_20568 [Blattamonas nauphoetae]
MTPQGPLTQKEREISERLWKGTGNVEPAGDHGGAHRHSDIFEDLRIVAFENGSKQHDNVHALIEEKYWGRHPE